jgi:hypothetical protein
MRDTVNGSEESEASVERKSIYDKEFVDLRAEGRAGNLQYSPQWSNE